MEYECDRYDPVRRYPPKKPLSMVSDSASFLLLELILDPTRTPPLLLRDTILVSMDLEYRDIESLGKTQITQVGIASLDTRILGYIDPEDSQSLLNAVQSRVFDVYPKRQAVSKKAWVPKCMWSTHEMIKHDEVCDKLTEIFPTFESESTKSSTTFHEEPCNDILIGHSIRHDRGLLLQLFDFDIKSVSTIEAILDTGRMMCSAYDFWVATHSHFPLRVILRCLEIRYDQFHNAGNDAMFTVKALLLMFSNWRHHKGRFLWNIAEDVMLNASNSHWPTSINTQNLLWDCQLEYLTAIARESWPVQKKPAICRSTMLMQPRKAQIDTLLSSEDLELTQMFG